MNINLKHKIDENVFRLLPVINTSVIQDINTLEPFENDIEKSIYRDLLDLKTIIPE